jgi:hypothetical protein
VSLCVALNECPVTELANAVSLPLRFFTSNQIALAAFLGGPVGLVYCLRANFLALGNIAYARRTVVLGTLGVLMMAATLFLSERSPGPLIVIAEVVIARGAAAAFVKLPAGQYDLHRYPRVFLVSLISIPASIVAVGLPLFVALVAAHLLHYR